ncbi:hypothetical protein NCS57_00936600 [Fusarium keratoplasticum]|uniref:Uncharacterized protein n=1 Tax=Fusarium keratoplasticum TaxID=1328300 RepID=A0ACC0QQB2_9HYPO|nr:hypothetical protein NCS57_00936600 [Fusarium keratoplasticum]KAI8663360.1 hypothetical protein NCS57_00936600 [Fusarium keratoplasticum]KAI8664048.1 hypothetical protein NCS55_00911700 [Fusarium keratoplasticum]
MSSANAGDPQDLNTVKVDTSVESPNELRQAMDWKILSHELFNETDDKGEPVKLIVPDAHDIAGYHIRLRIEWTVDPSNKEPTDKEWKEGHFIERDVQHVDEGKVLEYWKALGGRDAVSGIPEDFAHVLRILEEGGKPKRGKAKYKLQFVGYSAEKNDVGYWSRDKLKYNYPELLQEWEERDE